MAEPTPTDTPDPGACPDVDTLFAYIGGYLREDEGSAVELHLSTCDECGLVVAEAARGLTSDVDASTASAATAAASTPTSPAPRRLPKIGDTVGRYHLLEVLGRGAMGIVYSAYDPELDRKVAVKLVHTGRAGLLATMGVADPELEARLLGEAQAMARLSHPNVVAVHDIGTVDGGIYLAMELVPGQTLRAWLAAEPRPWRVIVDAFAQAAEGLAAAHAAGIVHRDFKPDNVLVDAAGRVRVTDFGLARTSLRERTDPTELTASADLRRTRAGTIIGTPAYMAPEQMAGAPVDARADIFALGASLYEALFGKRPYPGRTLAELEQALARGTPDEPPPAKVPAWVRRLVMRAVQADPAARFPTMQALIAALRADPQRRLRRVAVPLGLAAVVATTVGVVWHLTTAEARGCRQSAEVADTVWGPEARAAAEQAFLASGKPFAAESFATASAALERHLATWRVSRIEACDATHEHGTQSPALLDLRLACLDQRLTETRALTDAFARADAGAVERAAEAVAHLPAPAICGETERLTARVPPPVDPAAAARVHEAQAALARAATAELTGDWAAGIAAAGQARELAQRAGHAPTEAEALTLLAGLTFSSGDHATARALYEQAIPLGVAAGDDRVAAEACLGYTRLIAHVTRDGPDGLRWAALAEAQITRVGSDPELAARLLVERANLRFVTFEAAQGISDLERADGLQRRSGAPAPTHVATLKVLAEAYQQAERYDDAIATFERAIALGAEALGPSHPRVVALGQSLGICLASAGHYAAAERQLGEVERALAHLYNGAHLDVATTLHLRAYALTGLGRYDEAEALHRRGRALEVELLGERNAQSALTATMHAQAQLRAGRPKEALATLALARSLADEHFAGVAAMDATLGTLHALALEADGAHAEAFAALTALEPKLREEGGTELAMTLDALGRALVRQGQAAQAIARHQEALAILDKSYGKSNLELAPTLSDLGAALLAAGRRDDAVAALERALAILGAEPSDPLLGAEVRWTLADALAASDPERAEGVRAQALTTARASAYPRAARLLARADEAR